MYKPRLGDSKRECALSGFQVKIFENLTLNGAISDLLSNIWYKIMMKNVRSAGEPVSLLAFACLCKIIRRYILSKPRISISGGK